MPNALLAYPKQPPTYWGGELCAGHRGSTVDLSASGTAHHRRDVSSGVRPPRRGLERDFPGGLGSGVGPTWCSLPP